MKIRMLCFIVLLFLIFNVNLHGQYEACKGWICFEEDPNPGGDYADDNYSYSSGNTEPLFLVSPGVLIFKSGYFKTYENTDHNLKQNAFVKLSENPEELLNAGRVLIIPSAGFFGKENDATLKLLLSEYVRLGGTIIVFGQQYGSHIDKVVPVPEGESLHSYGWREDQSCYWGSSYFKGMHPALAAMTAERVSAAVDGYFAHYPAESTVLLRKISNQEPCLLYYPYGQGTPIPRRQSMN